MSRVLLSMSTLDISTCQYPFCLWATGVHCSGVSSLLLLKPPNAISLEPPSSRPERNTPNCRAAPVSEPASLPRKLNSG